MFLQTILQQARTYTWSHDRSRSYLQDRGVTKEQVEQFGIGYIPEDSWPPHVEGGSTDRDRYRNWSGKGGRLKDKLIFPVRNPVGDLMGIEVRTPSHEVKDYSKFYLEHSEAEARMFGVHEAVDSIWETGDVFLCEGLFDHLVLNHCYDCVVCTLTARISQRQMTFLHRMAQEVYLAFDMDDMGQKSFDMLVNEYTDDFEWIHRVRYPAQDLSDFWANTNPTLFCDTLEQQRTSL